MAVTDYNGGIIALFKNFLLYKFKNIKYFNFVISVKVTIYTSLLKKDMHNSYTTKL